MIGIPKYNIVGCCDPATNNGVFQIPGAGPIADGLYQYTGISFVESVTGMSFITGYCYTVTSLGDLPGTSPLAFNSADITVLPGEFNCEINSVCADCELSIPTAFIIYPCCDTDNTTVINMDFTDCVDDGNVWVYEGEGFTTADNFVFVPGQCYHTTQTEDGWYVPGPPCEDFTFTEHNTCLDAEELEACPSCSPTLQYLQFTSCCDDTVVLFKGTNADLYFGVREYLGTPVNGLINVCYSIEILDVVDLDAYNALPEPPTYIEGVSFTTLSRYSTDCEAVAENCPSCDTVCYTLYSCDGQIFNTTIDLSAYVGQYISISNVSGPILGVWYVSINTGKCDDALNDITVDEETPEPCEPYCYEVTGSGKITYIGETLGLETAYAPYKFCSYIYPQVSGIYNITSTGLCTIEEGTNELNCPAFCYTLTNCLTEVVYNSNTQTLAQYVGGVVTINGYEGCWQVEINEGDCDCPINVTVLQSFETCQDCLPVVAYKFTNCENSLQVQYSDQDFSDYVGQSVQLSCGQCWFVEEINYRPPSVQTITIEFTYENCQACARTYYKLEDCNGVEDDVYTYTDLSLYVDSNLVIKLKDCDTCWIVTETRELLSEAGIVTFDVSYEDCEACGNSIPCVCNSIRNDGTIATTFQYVDCSGTTQTTPLIQPGETSLRYCLRAWLDDVELTNYVKSYGECVEGTCPPMEYNLRSVKPGYNTPACSADKYDTISCKSSQALYRQVLTLRYGISNCCPEDDEYWLIKKELIDIAALYNPEYPCAPNGCGCGTSNCGCGCSGQSDCSCNQCGTCNS